LDIRVCPPQRRRIYIRGRVNRTAIEDESVEEDRQNEWKGGLLDMIKQGRRELIVQLRPLVSHDPLASHDHNVHVGGGRSPFSREDLPCFVCDGNVRVTQLTIDHCNTKWLTRHDDVRDRMHIRPYPFGRRVCTSVITCSEPCHTTRYGLHEKANSVDDRDIDGGAVCSMPIQCSWRPASING
jgi:hypothetical protein